MTENFLILTVIIIVNVIIILYQIIAGMQVADVNSTGHYLRLMGMAAIGTTVEGRHSPFYI
jgi:hypothetical protein